MLKQVTQLFSISRYSGHSRCTKCLLHY